MNGFLKRFIFWVGCLFWFMVTIVLFVLAIPDETFGLFNFISGILGLVVLAGGMAGGENFIDWSDQED